MTPALNTCLCGHEFTDHFRDDVKCQSCPCQGFTAPQSIPDDGLTDAQRRLVELDLRKPEITAYYEELEKVTAAVAAEVGVDGYFQAPDGTVYKLVRWTGQFVTAKQFAFERTKREGETRGTLSMKEAADAKANDFKPLQ